MILKLVWYFNCMLHACYLLFILCLSVKSSTELMLYVVLTMRTLNKAYLFIYLLLLSGNSCNYYINNVQTLGLRMYKQKTH
jgi:hypothetical protein